MLVLPNFPEQDEPAQTQRPRRPSAQKFGDALRG